MKNHAILHRATTVLMDRLNITLNPPQACQREVCRAAYVLYHPGAEDTGSIRVGRSRQCSFDFRVGLESR